MPAARELGSAPDRRQVADSRLSLAAKTLIRSYGLPIKRPRRSHLNSPTHGLFRLSLTRTREEHWRRERHKSTLPAERFVTATPTAGGTAGFGLFDCRSRSEYEFATHRVRWRSSIP